MNGEEGVAPIVERWRRASSAGKGMVLAINQYPLYKLRQRLRDALPDVSGQIERQWKARLVTGPAVDVPGGDSLLLIDLSLRNPLSRDFAGRVLDRMLSDPAVREHASSGSDPNFSFNFERLGAETVRERLFELFERVISSGRRTTVRELWILIARLLFGVPAVAEAPGVPRAWYSERLFAPDARFPLNEALRSVADPAAVSHPHVDREPRGEAGARGPKSGSAARRPAACRRRRSTRRVRGAATASPASPVSSGGSTSNTPAAATVSSSSTTGRMPASTRSCGIPIPMPTPST